MQWINIKMNKVEISRQKKNLLFYSNVLCSDWKWSRLHWY